MNTFADDIVTKPLTAWVFHAPAPEGIEVDTFENPELYTLTSAGVGIRMQAW